MVDLLFVWQLIVSGLDVIEHGAQFDSDSLQKVVLYYLIFLIVDLGSAALAFAMERKEKLRLLPWLVLQRFGYRQLMYYVVLKAGVRGDPIRGGPTCVYSQNGASRTEALSS